MPVDRYVKTILQLDVFRKRLCFLPVRQSEGRFPAYFVGSLGIIRDSDGEYIRMSPLLEYDSLALVGPN